MVCVCAAAACFINLPMDNLHACVIGWVLVWCHIVSMNLLAKHQEQLFVQFRRILLYVFLCAYTVVWRITNGTPCLGWVWSRDGPNKWCCRCDEIFGPLWNFTGKWYFYDKQMNFYCPRLHWHFIGFGWMGKEKDQRLKPKECPASRQSMPLSIRYWENLLMASRYLWHRALIAPQQCGPQNDQKGGNLCRTLIRDEFVQLRPHSFRVRLVFAYYDVLALTNRWRSWPSACALPRQLSSEFDSVFAEKKSCWKRRLCFSYFIYIMVQYINRLRNPRNDQFTERDVMLHEWMKTCSIRAGRTLSRAGKDTFVVTQPRETFFIWWRHKEMATFSRIYLYISRWKISMFAQPLPMVIRHSQLAELKCSVQSTSNDWEQYWLWPWLSNGRCFSGWMNTAHSSIAVFCWHSFGRLETFA